MCVCAHAYIYYMSVLCISKIFISDINTYIQSYMLYNFKTYFAYVFCMNVYVRLKI